MNEAGLVTALAVGAALAFGGVVTANAYSAFRRTGSPALRALAVGLAITTGAAAVGAGLHHVFGYEMELALSVQSVVTAVGLAALAASLYLEPSALTGRDGNSGSGN